MAFNYTKRSYSIFVLINTILLHFNTWMNYTKDFYHRQYFRFVSGFFFSSLSHHKRKFNISFDSRRKPRATESCRFVFSSSYFTFVFRSRQFGNHRISSQLYFLSTFSGFMKKDSEKYIHQSLWCSTSMEIE